MDYDTLNQHSSKRRVNYCDPPNGATRNWCELDRKQIVSKFDYFSSHLSDVPMHLIGEALLLQMRSSRC